MTAIVSPRAVKRASTRSAARRLLLAHGISVTGSEAQDFTLLLLTTTAYGAVLSVSSLGFAMTIGALLLGPVLATIQDRRPSQRGVLMCRIDAIRTVLTLAICAMLFAGTGPALAIYSLVVGLTVGEVLFQTALRSSVPLLVRDDDDSALAVSRLNASLLSHWAAVQVLVPPVFAVLLAVADPWVVILFNALTFAVSSAILRPYGRHIERSYVGTKAARPAADITAGATGSFWRDIREGVAIVAADRPVAAAMVLYAVTNAIGFAVLLSVPALLTTGETANELAIGLAFASLSMGALVGARLAGRDVVARQPLRYLLISPFLHAAALALVALVGASALVALPLFVFGAAIGLSNVTRLSFVQGRFADAVMSRVMSLYNAANQLLLPVAAVGGVMAMRVAGARGSYVLLGALAGLGGLGLVLVCRRSPIPPPATGSETAGKTQT